MDVRRRGALIDTELGWVRLRDHFRTTVGDGAGRGEALGDLLVLADATFAPRSSFPLHPHEAMEIVTVVLSGELVHREPGREVVVPEGSIQLISAGRGIVHAEGNRGDDPTRVLQIWLRPAVPNGAPSHRVLAPPALGDEFVVVTPLEFGGRGSSVAMACVAAGHIAPVRVAEGNVAYVICAEGAATIGGARCAAGGAGVTLGAGDALVTAHEAATLVAVHVRAPC